MRKILPVIFLMLATSGCAELHHKALGARVQSFEVGGVQFVHCSILMDRAKPQVAHDSIETCRDELLTPAAPKR